MAGQSCLALTEMARLLHPNIPQSLDVAAQAGSGLGRGSSLH